MSAPSLLTAGTSLTDPPVRATMSDVVSERFVIVTHAEIEALPAFSVMLLAQLRRYAFSQPSWFRITQANLQDLCGWSGESCQIGSLNSRTSRAMKILIDRGLIEVERRFWTDWATSTLRIKVSRPGDGLYEKLPLSVLDRLSTVADGLGSQLVKHYLVWRALCGKNGHGLFSLAQAKEMAGAGLARTRRLRQHLVAMELLFVRPGRGGADLVSFTPLPAPAVDLDTKTSGEQYDANEAVNEEIAGLGKSVEPLSTSSTHPCQFDQLTPINLVNQYEELDLSHTCTTDPRLGPQGRISKPTREHATAQPSSTTDEVTSQAHDDPRPLEGHQTSDLQEPVKVSRDQYAGAARRFVATCPHTRSLDGKTRGMLRQWLAAQLRSLPAGQIDQALTMAGFELDFHEHLRDGGLFNHRAAMVKVFDRIRLDRLAAPVVDQPTVDESGLPDWYQRGEGLTGPDLETIAGQDLPTAQDTLDDPEARLQRCTVMLANCLLDELETEPDLDIETALDHARHRATLLLEPLPGLGATLSCAPRGLRNAWKVSWRRLYDDGQLTTQPTSDELAEIEAAQQEFFALRAARQSA